MPSNISGPPMSLEQLCQEAAILQQQWFVKVGQTLQAICLQTFHQSQQDMIKDLERQILHMLHYGSKIVWFTTMVKYTGPNFSGAGLADVLNGTNRNLLRHYVSTRVKLHDTNVTSGDIKGLLRGFSGVGGWKLDALHPSETAAEADKRIKHLQQDFERLGRGRRMLHTLKWRLGDVDVQRLGHCIPTTKWLLCQEIKRCVSKLITKVTTNAFGGFLREIVQLRKKVEELKDIDEVYRVCGPFVKPREVS